MKEYKISALYICTIIGAGFATGKELLVYFIQYGILGFIGILISSLIFGYVIYKILYLNYRDINELSTNILFKILIFISLIVILSAMLSANGELFHNIFNMSIYYGNISLGLLILLTIYLNIDLKNLSFVLFPIIVAISIITSIYILCTTNFEIYKTPINFKFMPYALIYSAYNIITAVSILITENKGYNSVKNAVISSISIFIIATILSAPLYLNYEVIKNSNLPILELLHSRGIIYYLYIFMLVSAIFSTAVTALKSAYEQSHIPILLLVLISFVLAQIGFNNIIAKVYFIFGILGISILLILVSKSKN